MQVLRAHLGDLGDAQPRRVGERDDEAQAMRGRRVGQGGGVRGQDAPLALREIAPGVDLALDVRGRRQAAPGVADQVALAHQPFADRLEDRDRLADGGRREWALERPPRLAPVLAMARRAPERRRLRIAQEIAVFDAVFGGEGGDRLAFLHRGK